MLVQKTLNLAGRLIEEPPFRLFTKAIIKRLPVSLQTKSRWDVVSRPHYLLGVLAAAEEARREGVDAFSVFEFGVAGGDGLLALEEYAGQVQAKTGICITVYGFDSGEGLVEVLDDYRDHPDQWLPGDFPMDERKLRKKLKATTNLILGPISRTVPDVIPHILDPIGFVSVDVDTYSGTRDVLRMFALGPKLNRVMMYFDDIDLFYNHPLAGEPLAIDEFNATSKTMVIDIWRAAKKKRPFPEAPYLNRMFIAHDLEAISKVRLERRPTLIALGTEAGFME